MATAGRHRGPRVAGADGQPAPAAADGETCPSATALPPRARWRRATAAATAVAATVSVFSAGVLYADLRNGGAVTTVAVQQQVLPPPSGTTTAQSTTSAAAPVPVRRPSNVPRARLQAAALRAAPPVRLTISELGIDQSLIELAVNKNRQLEVPKSYDDIGWWSDGPAPGGAGAALMVGHVDSTSGPAVFYRLSSLTTGSLLSVKQASGDVVDFRVTGQQTFAKDDFPDDLVYRTTGKPSLHLVTCGGTFDRATGHYRDNVVVFADLVTAKPPKPATTTRATTAAPARRSGVTNAEAKAGDSANAAIERYIQAHERTQR